MGLDMYATVIKGKVNSEVDFDTNNIQDYEELHYWRKHPNLHGWMQNLYYDKGGKDDSFNGSDVVLTESDLDSFDLEFVAKARKAIKEGKTVYYSSSW